MGTCDFGRVTNCQLTEACSARFYQLPGQVHDALPIPGRIPSSDPGGSTSGKKSSQSLLERNCQASPRDGLPHTQKRVPASLKVTRKGNPSHTQSPPFATKLYSQRNLDQVLPLCPAHASFEGSGVRRVLLLKMHSTYF